MVTVYVFDNELLGDSGQDFDNALTQVRSFLDNASAEIWFNGVYGYNDYTMSYTSPTGEILTDRVLVDGTWN